MFEEFKALADKKKELFDGDIEALVLRAEGSASGPWTLRELKTVGGQREPRRRGHRFACSTRTAAPSSAR